MRREFDQNAYTSTESVAAIIKDQIERQHRYILDMTTLQPNGTQILNPQKALLLLKPDGEKLRNELNIFHDYEARARIHPALMQIRSFALEAIKLDPKMYAYVPERIKNSPSFSKAVIEQHSFLYDAMPERIRNNSQVKETYINTYLTQTECRILDSVKADWPKYGLCKSIDPHEIFTPDMYKAAFKEALEQGVRYSTGEFDTISTFDNYGSIYPNDRFGFIHTAKALCPDMTAQYNEIEKEVIKEQARYIRASLMDSAYGNRCSDSIEYLLRSSFVDNQEAIRQIESVIESSWEERAKHVISCHSSACRKYDYDGDMLCNMSDAEHRHMRQEFWVVSQAERDRDLFKQHLGSIGNDLHRALCGVTSAQGQQYSDNYYESIGLPVDRDR